jgi:hypothetical protein
MAISNSQKVQWGRDETGPVWGARAFAPKSGQDHLGLGSVSSDRILSALSPGINVLTIHPRYWSFYSWCLMASGPLACHAPAARSVTSTSRVSTLRDGLPRR